MIFGILAAGLFVTALLAWVILLGPWLRQRRWGALADALGLTPEAPASRGWVIIPFQGPFPSQPLHGERGGLRVTVATRSERYRSSRGVERRRWFTYASAMIPTHLGLGLQVQERGWLGRVFDGVTGADDLVIGDAAADARLLVQAGDRGAAERLLQLGYVSEGIIGAVRDGWRLSVTDSQVRLETTGIEYSPRALGRRLDMAVDLVQRLSAGRRETLVDGLEVERAQQWAEVGRELGLEGGAQGLSGRRHQMYVEAACVEHDGRWWTSFTVRYDRSLGVSLSLTRQTTLASFGNLVGMQDIEVGDPAFDARFVVKGAPEAKVRELLTPEVRDRLVMLQDQATRLEVADDHVTAWVGWRVIEAAHLRWGIDAIAQTGAAIAGVTPVEVGPFRGV